MNRICNIYSESAYVDESLSSPIEKLRLKKFRDAMHTNGKNLVQANPNKGYIARVRVSRFFRQEKTGSARNIAICQIFLCAYVYLSLSISLFSLSPIHEV